MTQETLAERTGLGVRSIQHLEGGAHLPHRETVGRLIKGLGITGAERSAFEAAAQPAQRHRDANSSPAFEARDRGKPRHNLPAQLTSFVGRENELTDVKRLLDSTRLLTITGVGGTGKTRLALHVATDLLDSFPDGAWLVDLAPLADPELVVPTVASALGVQRQSGQSILTTLLYVLSDQKILLIVDNCEHLIDPCARLAETILRGCPLVKILATSREGLRITGEVIWALPSLPVPAADWQASQRVNVAALDEFAAIHLFVDRARAVEAGFKVSDQNASAVVQICRRVDGIPLAIELAAARVMVFSPERIAGRLDDLFRLLTGGSRTALPRQQTLKATIDWSHDLLSEPERILFRRLSVFVGGCSYEAIEGVCSGEGIGDLDIPDLLIRLVERSLVLAERGEQDRYRMLETLRQYGRDRLIEAGEAEALRDRHRDWFLRFAERAKPELIGPDQVLWFDRLEGEHDNLRAALEWSLERGPAELGLRLVAAIWRLWLARDYLAEGQDWVTRALAAPGASEPTLIRAEVLIAAAEIMNNLGEITVNLEGGTTWPRLAEEARAIYQTLGDRRGVSRAMFMLRHIASSEERVEEQLGAALVVALESGSQWDIGQIIQHLGFSSQRQGDYPLAQRRLAEAVAIFRRVGDHRAIVVSLEGLGDISCRVGELASAHAYLEEALMVSRELRSDRRTSWCLDTLGVLAWLEGDCEQSRAFLEEGIPLARRVGDRDSTGLLLFHLGLVARAEGDPARAETIIRESVSISLERGSRGNRADAIRFAGVLAIEGGEHRRGLRLFGAVDRQTSGRWWLGKDDLRAYEDSLATARAALGEADFAAAWAEGRAMTLEEAVASALREAGHRGTESSTEERRGPT